MRREAAKAVSHGRGRTEELRFSVLDKFKPPAELPLRYHSSLDSGYAGSGKLTFGGETDMAPFLLSSYTGAVHAHR